MMMNLFGKTLDDGHCYGAMDDMVEVFKKGIIRTEMKGLYDYMDTDYT